MKVVYFCYGGAHSSVTAAAIHLNMLPVERVPSAGEILAVPYFDRQNQDDHGRFQFMGDDEYGNQVYSIGCRSLGSSFIPLVYGICRAAGIANNDLMLVNSLSSVNLWMMVGGYLSRRLKLVKLGRPIVIWGTRIAYLRFVQVVRGVKASCCNHDTKFREQTNLLLTQAGVAVDGSDGY